MAIRCYPKAITYVFCAYCLSALLGIASAAEPDDPQLQVAELAEGREAPPPEPGARKRQQALEHEIQGTGCQEVPPVHREVGRPPTVRVSAALRPA